MDVSWSGPRGHGVGRRLGDRSEPSENHHHHTLAGAGRKGKHPPTVPWSLQDCRVPVHDMGQQRAVLHDVTFAFL